MKRQEALIARSEAGSGCRQPVNRVSLRATLAAEAGRQCREQQRRGLVHLDNPTGSILHLAASLHPTHH